MTSPRYTKRSVLTLAIAVLIAFAGWRSWRSTASDGASEAALSPAGGAAIEDARQDGSIASARVDAPPTGEGQQRAPESATTRSLRCVSAAEGLPLSGVCAYKKGAQRAGPSDELGRLELAGGLAGSVVLWCEGRVPLILRCESLPDEARLVAADCALELVLTEMTLDHKLLRSSILRSGVSLGQGPWTPKLHPGALDVFSAEALPPGTYDLFFWIKEGRQAARAHEVRGVELLAGERKRVVHSRLNALPEDDDS